MAGPARHAAGGLDVIGRAAEQRRIEQLCAPGSGVTAIVLTGEAGIGKTALWEWSIRHLAADGTTVLASRAVKAEAGLAWAGLADLLASIREAAGELRSIGALAWAAQADAELARVNVRRTAPAALTETERRIAELAATGLTNREIAHQMFLSPKTIESNIARVYQKLGIRSRAELGSRLGRTGQDWSGPTAE